MTAVGSGCHKRGKDDMRDIPLKEENVFLSGSGSLSAVRDSGGGGGVRYGGGSAVVKGGGGATCTSPASPRELSLEGKEKRKGSRVRGLGKPKTKSRAGRRSISPKEVTLSKGCIVKGGSVVEQGAA